MSSNAVSVDLTRINAHWMALPEETRNRPVFEFANRPPPDRAFLTTRLWDQYRPKWREVPKLDFANPEIRARLEGIVHRNFVGRKAASVPAVAPEKVEALSQQRIVRKRKGDWHQLPPDVAES